MNGRKAVVVTSLKTEEYKYEVDIGAELKPWYRDEITTEEIADLGGWDVADGVILVNLVDGTERTLKPDEVIKLESDIGFSKKMRFKRG